MSEFLDNAFRNACVEMGKPVERTGGSTAAPMF
jgi:hypothetical protein